MSTSEAQIALGPEGRLPRRFGRYALFDFIGKGGMAEIYLARAHTDLGASRLCVVKQILSEFALHPQFAEMLIHEAKLAARLNHAHIVQVFDLGRERDQLFIAMEYIEGFDLNALLRRCSQKKVPLPFEFAMRIVSDALSGLDYAHRRTGEDGKPLGIVHRDVSPSNLLVSLEGEVKVCDFGIAHANDVVFQHSDLQMDEAIRGKAGYMSPEHARGEPIDARADVFAVGIVMWELLAGRRMYRRESDVPLLDQAKAGEIPPLPVKGLPHETKLHGIVMKALANKRDDRYPTAGAMLRDLDAYMSDAKMVASPLKLGAWLMDNFGTELIEQRRARDLSPEGTTDSPPEPVVAVTRVSSPFLSVGATSAANGAGGGRVSSIPPMPPSSSARPAAASPAASSPAPAPPLTASSPAPAPPLTSSSPPAAAALTSSAPAPVVEVKRVEPDPPSLPASTVDVVPSSAMRSGGFATAKRRTSVALLVGAVVAAIVLTILAVVARHR